MAIACAVTHWLALFYSLIFENTGVFSKSIALDRYAPVYEGLLYLNFVPLKITEIVGNTLNATAGMNFLLDITLLISGVLIVNLQWLVVGHIFSKPFNLFNQETDNYLKIK